MTTVKLTNNKNILYRDVIDIEILGVEEVTGHASSHYNYIVESVACTYLERSDAHGAILGVVEIKIDSGCSVQVVGENIIYLVK